MCPPNETGESQCNKEVLAKLLQAENNDSKEANPMWQALNKFKDLK